MAIGFEQFKQLRSQGLSIDQITRFDAGEQPKFSPDTSQDFQPNEDVGILGKGFDVPSAPAREGIRENPWLSTFGPLAGLASLTGVGGKKAQASSIEAIKNPSTSEKFQDEAIRKVQENVSERASRRTGLFSPQTKLGKFVMGSEMILAGHHASQAGFVQDFATNPLDVLLSLGDIVSAGKSLLKATKTASASKKAISTYKQAVKPRLVSKTKGAAAASDAKIAQGLEAIVDNKANLQYLDDAGRLPENINESISAASQTKDEIFQQYNNLRKATGSEVKVNMKNVAAKVFESQADEAARIANPKLRQSAFVEAKRLADEGEVTLDVAEGILKKWNKELAPLYKAGGGSADDITKAQVKATAASALRKELDNLILVDEKGKSYQLLKKTYGSLVETEMSLVKRADQLSKVTRTSSGEVLDTVPIIYGAFTGNVPLVAAGVGQRALKGVLKARVNPNNLIKNTFKLIGKSDKFVPIGTTITSLGKSEERIRER